MRHRTDHTATHPSRPWGLLLAGVLILFAASGGLLAAATDAQTFKDWRVRCEKPEGADEERCFLFQNVMLKKGKQQLLNIAVGYLQNMEHPVAVLTLPLGISLPPGVEFKVDGGEPMPLQVEHCLDRGCRVLLGLDDKLLAILKAGSQAQVTFYDGARRPIGVPVSLMGFTAGFNALTK